MRLRNQVLGQTLAQWFAEDGHPSADQILAAERVFDAADRIEAVVTP